MAVISMSVTVNGLTELLAKFEVLAANVGTHADEVALGAAEDAKAAGDPLTPVRTGYLKSRNQTRPAGPGSAEFYNNCYYAIPVCLGHHTRSGSWVPARDWMTPAIYAGAQGLVRRAAQIVQVP